MRQILFVATIWIGVFISALLATELLAAEENKELSKIVQCAAFFDLAGEVFSTHGEGGAAEAEYKKTAKQLKAYALRREQRLGRELGKIDLEFNAYRRKMVRALANDVSRFALVVKTHQARCKALAGIISGLFDAK